MRSRFSARSQLHRAAPSVADITVKFVHKGEDRRVAQTVTSISLRVRSSTPFAASITTGSSPPPSGYDRYLPRSLRARGVEQVNQAIVIRKLHHRRRMEIPRCFSISIQSDLACWLDHGLLLYRRSEWPVRTAAPSGDGSLTGVRVRNNGKSAALRTSCK